LLSYQGSARVSTTHGVIQRATTVQWEKHVTEYGLRMMRRGCYFIMAVSILTWLNVSWGLHRLVATKTLLSLLFLTTLTSVLCSLSLYRKSIWTCPRRSRHYCGTGY